MAKNFFFLIKNATPEKTGEKGSESMSRKENGTRNEDKDVNKVKEPHTRTRSSQCYTTLDGNSTQSPPR